MCQGFENWPPLQRPRAPRPPPPLLPPPPQGPALPGRSASRHPQQVAPLHHATPRAPPTWPPRSESRLGSWEEDSGVFGGGPERGLSPTALITSEPQKHTPLSLGRQLHFRNRSANFRKGPDSLGRGCSGPLSPSALIAERRTDTKGCGSVPGTPHFPNQELLGALGCQPLL